MAAPPSYDEVVQASASELRVNESGGMRIDEESVRSQKQEKAPWSQPPSGLKARSFTPVVNPRGISLPCVIPQTSKSFRGPFFSPFVRAYVPELEAHGISEETFVACVDGLNEAFIAHPVFQGLDLAGNVMGQFYGLHPVQLAGTGLSVASGLASAATSIARARAYVKAVNMDLFNPAGLQLNIMTTTKMMERIRYPERERSIFSIEATEATDENPGTSNAISDRDAPHARRLRGLEGYVMPLRFDVPRQVMPDNFLRKMGAAQSARLEKKQNKKMLKERQEGEKKYGEKFKEAEKKQREADKEIAKLAQKLENERAKMEKDFAKDGDKAVSRSQKEEEKISKEIEKEVSKREKEVAKQMQDAEKERGKGTEKEDKATQKMRWIVITRLSQQDESRGEGEHGEHGEHDDTI